MLQGTDQTQKQEAEANQLERFKEAARQLGCDEDEAAFDTKLSEIAQRMPTKSPAQGKK